MNANGSSPGDRLRWLRWLPVVVLLSLFIALTLVWRSPTMSRWLDPVALSQLGTSLLAMPLGPLAVLGGYVVAALLAMPIGLMISVGVLVFGAWPGMFYALVGMVSGAVVTYGLGRWFGVPLLQRFANPRVLALGARLRRRGLFTVIFIRALPIAPFLVVNLAAGALKIRLRDFVLGSFIGLLPSTIIIALFMDRLLAAWRDPGVGSYMVVAACLVVVAGVVWLMRKRLMAVMSAEVRP